MFLQLTTPCDGLPVIVRLEAIDYARPIDVPRKDAESDRWGSGEGSEIGVGWEKVVVNETTAQIAKGIDEAMAYDDGFIGCDTE